MEVLAPAGSYDALIAAIDSGANAVYLAGPKFGARKFASNFTMDMMEEAVTYAHLRNVSVYVTVNTLIFDDEFADVMSYIDELYLMHVDAVILQDIGVIAVTRKLYPDLAIHASTQMSAYSLDDFKFLESLGVERVVVAREMSVEEIAEIKKNVNVELEVFVHGALCYSVSGQCLMSSFKGGRSGNRGMCAQPCRHFYESDGRKGFLLSPKDLNGLYHVEALMKLGVESIKIEGRMKRSEYVGEVVEAYRFAVDGGLAKDLSKVFNREYTEGFLGNDFMMQPIYPGHFGEIVGKVVEFKSGRMYFQPTTAISVNDELQIRRGKDTVGTRVEYVSTQGERVKFYEGSRIVSVPMKYPVEAGETIYRTVDELYYKAAKQRIHDRNRRNKIDVVASFSPTEGAKMKVSGLGHTVEVCDSELVQVAAKRPMTEERIMEQLVKVAELPFDVDVTSLTVSDDCFMPISSLNQFRTSAYEKLASAIISREERESKKYRPLHISNNADNQVTWCATYRTDEQREALLEAGISSLYKVTDGESEDLVYPMRMHKLTPKDGGYASQWGDLVNQKRVSRHLNVVNSESVKYLLSLGVEVIEASLELNSRQVAEIAESYPGVMEVMGYGHVPVMVVKQCPHIQATCNRCGLCANGQVTFVNNDGSMYYLAPSAKDFCELYTSEPFYLGEEQGALDSMGIASIRFDFLYETGDEVRAIIDAFEGEEALNRPSGLGHFRLGAK